MGSMELRVLAAGFPVWMTVVTMITMITVVIMITVVTMVTVVIMITVVLSTHPKTMHQILQFWQEKNKNQKATVQSVRSAPASSPPPKSGG